MDTNIAYRVYPLVQTLKNQPTMDVSMGRKAGGKDFSPRVRTIFDDALRESIADGTLYPKLKAQLLEDPVGTIQRMSAYAPKQVDMTLDQQVTIDTTKLTREVIESLYQLEEPSEHNEGTTPAVH